MHNLSERLPESAKKVWRINATITTSIFAILTLAFFITRIWWHNMPLFIGFILLGYTVIQGVLFIFVIPPIRLKIWGYEIRENEVDIQFGLIIRKRVLIPMSRIQHVDTEKGPIQRIFNLATLSITTAGSNHKIPALLDETAILLRSKISRLADMSDEDV